MGVGWRWVSGKGCHIYMQLARPPPMCVCEGGGGGGAYMADSRVCGLCVTGNDTCNNVPFSTIE